MTSQKLEQIIQGEIESNQIENWHGITKENIQQHLIKPILIDIVTAWNNQLNKYWLVLDERPDDKKIGYQIIFDEKESKFGLATKTGTKTNGIGVMIGLYGSFINTLNGM